MDALDRLQPEKSVEKLGDGDGEVVEIAGEGDEAEKELETLKINDERKTDIQRIRAKALMRRAKARSEQGGWSNLQGAEEGEGLARLLRRCLWLTGFRLQRAGQDAHTADARYENRQDRTGGFTTSDQCGQRKGNGGYDGKAERGRLLPFHGSISRHADIL